ncbi:MAG: hypothetical protein PHC53_02630 [Patescibacteria group bacterium]|nr:hypothetical protein [Patescibacteria group bacterium]
MGKTIGKSPKVADQNMLDILTKLQTHMADALLVSGALAIGTTKTKVNVAAAMYALIDGALVTKAITNDAFTLAGTVTNAKFNVFVLTLKADGTCTARMGTEAATLGAVVLPAIPAGEVVVGLLIVNPTGTGNFVGGTTNLDDGTVVPNAVYINTARPFNPNVLSL